MARTITGVVASDKADKTIVITVLTRKTHPIYKKQYTVTTRFMAHDEKNEASVGDKVIISETRPLSKRKRFALEKVLEKARITHVEPEANLVQESPVSSQQSPAKEKKLKTDDKKLKAAKIPKVSK
jgi:small subunit ribosomal protein S17